MADWPWRSMAESKKFAVSKQYDLFSRRDTQLTIH